MSKLTAAYLAGLIDGEGYLGIQKRVDNNMIGGYAYVGVLKVCMINKPLIQWLKDSFGGYFSERIKKNGDSISYEWSLRHGGNIKPILDKIFPYLKVKRGQAEILRVFFKTFDRKNYIVGYPSYLSTETKKERDKLYWRIRELNCKKGKNSIHWQSKRLNEETSPLGEKR